MGHDHHFLSRLDRVRSDQVDVALGLYRDHEAVAYVLERLTLKADFERVALSLGSKDRGPFVVVARNGHFVTCLGEGMSTGALEVVPWDRLEALLANHRDLKGREDMREREQRKNERLYEFFGRLLRRGHAMNREEFIAFSAFQPLLGKFYCYQTSIASAQAVISQVPVFAALTKIKPHMREQAHQFHIDLWLTGHAMLLTTLAELDELDVFANDPKIAPMFTRHCAMLSSSTVLLRGMWAAARVGKAMLPAYKNTLATSTENQPLIDATFAVLAIGLRHADARKEAHHILAGAREGDNMTGVRKPLAESALMILDAPSPKREDMVALEMGRSVFFQLTRNLPEGDPYRFATEAEVPIDLATTAALAHDFDYVEPTILAYLFEITRLVATAGAEDFYYPREVARRILPEWTPEETLANASRFGRTMKLSQDPVVRAEPKVGRNDPCPCGSGKKYKKCHGA